jgi:hypothetical protein
MFSKLVPQVLLCGRVVGPKGVLRDKKLSLTFGTRSHHRNRICERENFERHDEKIVWHRLRFHANSRFLTGVSIHGNELGRARALVPRRKDCGRGLPKQRNQTPGDTSRESAAPPALATDSILRPGPLCKDLSEASPVVVRLFPSHERAFCQNATMWSNSRQCTTMEPILIPVPHPE